MDTKLYQSLEVELKYDNTPHSVAKRSIQVIEAFNYFVLFIVTMVILFFMYTCCIIGKAKKAYNQQFQEHCPVHPEANLNEMQRQANSEFPNDHADTHHGDCHQHHNCHQDYQSGHFDCGGADGHVCGADAAHGDNGGFCGADVVVLTLM